MRSRFLGPTAALFFIMCATAACDRQPEDPPTRDMVPITTTSDEARAAYMNGRDLLEALQFTDAHLHFVKATELDPQFALAWMAAANTSPTAHEFFAAMRHAVANAAAASEGEQMIIRAFEAGVNAEPDTQRSELEALACAYTGDERAHNALANFLFAQQEYDAAITEYQKAIEINPEFSQPYNQLGYAHRFLGNFDAAERAFKRYVELIPDKPNPYDSYAELLMKMGRFTESIQSYEKALEVEPSFIASYVGIAHNLFYTDRPEEARVVLERIREIARNTGELRLMHTWCAASYLHEGDTEGALSEIRTRFEIAREIDDLPAMSGDLALMGNILLNAGRPDLASSKFVESVETIQFSDVTEDIKTTVRRNHTFDLARVALRKGDLDSAIDLAAVYREAVAINNVRIEIQQSRQLDGMVSLAKGEPKAALFDLANANQQNPQVLFLNARAFAVIGDREAARAACRQVVDFNQLSFNLAYVRGSARKLLKSL